MNQSLYIASWKYPRVTLPLDHMKTPLKLPCFRYPDLLALSNKNLWDLSSVE